MAATTTLGKPGPAPDPIEEEELRGTEAPRGLRMVAEVGQLVGFSFSVLRVLPGSVRYLSEALRQVARIILGTSPLLFVMYTFFGIITINTGYFLLYPLGAADYVGEIGGFGIHVSAVIIFAYVFTAKVCGGFVAELGAMQVNQEIDALESTGVDPLRFVVGSRMLATLMFIPIATVVSLLGYYFGCYLDGVVILHATFPAGFNEFNWLSQGIRDELFVLVTTALTAVATAITACYFGLRTKGGPAAVGGSVAKAVKYNLVIASTIQAFTVILWYLKTAGVPIGG
jgi:phospholipid/cholesterol/gamma-HCH transport system permease protein